MYRAQITTIDGGEKETLRATNGRGYILERRVFDRVLAERPARAGAEVRVKAAATGLITADHTVRGVRIRQGDFLAGSDEVEVEGSSPKAKAKAKTAHKGLGYGTYGTVLGCLRRFIEAHPRLEQGYPVTLVARNVPVALSPARLVADGFMLVGDAARQVDPLTGGGIINTTTAGRLAAQVAVEAIASGDTSASSLQRYEEEWNRTVGRNMKRNYRLRERFPPGQQANKRFARAFALAAGG